MSDSGKEASSSNPATTTPHLGSGEYQPLVPLRVDVSLAGTNKASPSTPSLRIVETILFDPWVWPLKPKKLNDQTEWIEDNARYLAHNLLTDLEVQSMGRTIRHFTNRSDIWSIELQRKVMDQLRPQLQIVADMRQKNQRKRRRDETLFLRVEDDSTKKSRTSKVKQEENEMDDSIEKNETETETKPQSTVTSEGVASASTPLADEKEVKGESSSASKDPAEKMSDEASLSHLIPIQIRLSVHGIRVHDDCWWDPSMSSKVSPLDYAQSLGRDLNLSAEAVQSVAIDIAEQLYGSPRNGQIPSDLAIVDEGSVAQPNTRTVAVWSMDQRTHISHVAHLVAQHRQP